MAAIYKVIRQSQKLRGAEPSISTLCLGFMGRGFQKKYCRIHHFGGDLKKMAAISKVVRLSEKLRDTEPSISTLCLGSVGCRLEEKVLCSICQYCVSTILTFMAAILQNGSHFHE